MPQSPSGATAQERAAAARAMKQIRENLQFRQLTEAKQGLRRLEGLPKDAAQEQQAARLSRLVHYVENFWEVMGDALAGVVSGADLQVKNTTISLVEGRRDGLVIRAAGGNQRYQKLDIPGGIVVAIAEEYIDLSNPGNRLLLGAFYAVEPKGGSNGQPDVQTARTLFDEARRGGINLGDLPQVLDDKYE